MNRLQRLDEPIDYLVTLNGGARIDDDTVLARMSYTHPIYTPASVAAQAQLPGVERRPDRVRRCVPRAGASTRTAALSGVRAAASLGVEW